MLHAGNTAVEARVARADCRRPWTRMSMPHTGTQPHFGCCPRGCLEAQQRQKRNAEAVPPSPSHQPAHPWEQPRRAPWSTAGRGQGVHGPVSKEPPQGGEETGQALGIAARAPGLPGFCTGVAMSPGFPGRRSVTHCLQSCATCGSHLGKVGGRSIGQHSGELRPACQLPWPPGTSARPYVASGSGDPELPTETP